MNESYRRSLTTALERIERDLITLQRAWREPADGGVYREVRDGDPGTMVAAIGRALQAVREAARELDIPPRPVSLPWYARAQSLSHLITIDDLDPQRVGMSYGRLGEREEIERVTAVLAGLSRSIAELGEACGVAVPPGARPDEAANDH